MQAGKGEGEKREDSFFRNRFWQSKLGSYRVAANLDFQSAPSNYQAIFKLYRILRSCFPITDDDKVSAFYEFPPSKPHFCRCHNFFGCGAVCNQIMRGSP